MNISRQMLFIMVPLVWYFTTTCAGVGKTVTGEGRTGLENPYQLNQSTVSAGVWTTPFLHFHNAVNSGRTCIYFGKLFKNDVLRPLEKSFLEKFRILKTNITRAIEEVNERTLRKVARNMVKRVDKCTEMNGHHFQHLL